MDGWTDGRTDGRTERERERQRERGEREKQRSNLAAKGKFHQRLSVSINGIYL